MTGAARRGRTPRLLLLLCCAAAVPLVQAGVDQAHGAFRAQHEALYLPSGKTVRRLVPGFENVAADVYWLRTVQYFGGERAFAKDKEYKLLGPLVEITVTLDPRMEVAYRYGAIFLSEPRPTGAGRPRDGVALLERGVAAMPDNWRLYKELGFFHYIFLGDHRTAADRLLAGSRVPGAPYWMKTLAADILGKGNARDTARAIWQDLARTSHGPMRENALVHLQVLDAEDAADAAAAAAREFERRNGRRPESLDEVRAQGLVRSTLDPAGTPLAYDRSSGAVTVSRQSPLWRPE